MSCSRVSKLRVLTLFGALLALHSGAHAQTQEPATEASAPPPAHHARAHPRADAEPSAQESDLILTQRVRSAIHPGDPLHVVGNEQEGNDLRSRTPALGRTDHRAREVDEAELYRRTLAAYEDGAQFATPPCTSAPSLSVAARRAQGAAPEAVLTASRWPTVLGLSAGALVLVWLVTRSRFSSGPARRGP